MLTFQDFEEAKSKGMLEDFILKAIEEHKNSELYKTAVDADLYDKQRNKTINNYAKMIYKLSGIPVEDFTASNAKLASNFFARLNTQRCTYSLGNGVSFTKHIRKYIDEDGIEQTIDETKEKLGPMFDNELFEAGYLSLIHGVSFGYPVDNKLYVFPVTSFIPLFDEETGALRAGIRFWRIDDSPQSNKPLNVVLYEEDGVSQYKQDPQKSGGVLTLKAPKQAYKVKYQKAPADSEAVIVGTENPSSLPIVPYWGSKRHQSTLVGMQQKIDSFDLIRSGFANDLTDCSQVYWIIENCGGMNDRELAAYRDRLKLLHIATADTSNGGKITPYTQDIPYQARKTYLDDIRAGIYEDFGGLDVHTVAAGATNDHIDAAYQPMDENADDFEFQTIQFITQILALLGIDDMPQFKRNRISNQKEQVEMVLMEANYLDDETILNKLPNISPDEVKDILSRRDRQDEQRFTEQKPEEEEVVMV